MMTVELVNDGIENIVTAMGTPDDKSMYSRFVNHRTSVEELSAIYRSGGIGGKIVDIIPDDATRKWRTIHISEEFDRKKFDEMERVLSVRKAFNRAGKWARLYGGSVILIDIDGDDPREPLNVVSPSKPITGLQVRSRYDVSVVRLNRTTLRPEAIRDIRGSNTEYHASRFLGPFDGLTLSRYEQENEMGWGGSVIDRVYNALLADETLAAQINPIIHEAVVRTVGVRDLARYSRTEADRATFARRFALAKFLASTHNVFVYDKDDEVTDKSNISAITGLADVFQKFANRIASIVDIPMTRLFGEVTGGLNTSAATNLVDYYHTVSSYQADIYDEWLCRLDRLLLLSCYGRMPTEWWSEWVSLDEPTEIQKAELAAKWAETGIKLMTAGVLTGAQVARHLAATGPYAMSEEYLSALEERDGLRAAGYGNQQE